MEANEFVGFTLPIVNEGPWSYFSNGIISDGEDGEDEAMFVEGITDNDSSDFYLNETSKKIYDAMASGKTVIVTINDDSIVAYSLITATIFASDTYTFFFTKEGITASVSGAADEKPSIGGGIGGSGE